MKKIINKILDEICFKENIHSTLILYIENYCLRKKSSPNYKKKC